MSRRFARFATVTPGVALLALTACSDGTTTQLDSAELSPSFGMHAQSTGNRTLAAIRAATARYHRMEVATDAGYVPITPCVALPSGEAAMGFHYGNPGLIEDGGVIDIATPEALVYAPWRDGELRLVAVEYLILEGDWTEEAAPEMLGHEFHFVEDAGVWGFHAWIWQHNPDGVFADFNPRMSCDGTP